MRKEILNLHSTKPKPPRVFDVIVDETGTEIEIKNSKDEFERIPWDDVVFQVKAAQEVANKEIM